MSELMMSNQKSAKQDLKKGKILIFGGTSEGRRLCEELSLFGEIELTVCVATEYGTEMLQEIKGITVLEGRKDKDEISVLLRKIKPDICIDATHPYAQIVSVNVKNACFENKVEYIRLNRTSEQIMDSLNEKKCGSDNCTNELSSYNESGVIYFDTIDEAVTYLEGASGNILVTTGSKEVEKYSKLKNFEKKCYMRVLPSEESINLCKKCGVLSDHIIAMHGPFGVKLNEAIISQYDIKFMITKESGSAGGYLEKVQAAQNANVTLLVIRRPEIMKDGLGNRSDAHVADCTCDNEGACGDSDVFGYDSVKNAVIERFCRDRLPEITLVGVGPGGQGIMTLDGANAISTAQVIIGSKRMVEGAKEYLKRCYCKNLNKTKFIFSFLNDEIVEKIQAENNVQKIVVLYSGSTGFSSGAYNLSRQLKDAGYKTEIVCGISSLQYLFEKCQISYDNSRLMTSHGRELDLDKELDEIFEKRSVLGLLPRDASQIVNALISIKKKHLSDYANLRIALGERLSYENESIMVYNIDSFLEKFVDADGSKTLEFDALSAVIFYMSE